MAAEVSAAFGTTDLYAVLGLGDRAEASKTATPAAIKKAFFKQSLRWVSDSQRGVSEAGPSKHAWLCP